MNYPDNVAGADNAAGTDNSADAGETRQRDGLKTYLQLIATATERELTAAEIDQLNTATAAERVSGYDALLGDYFTQVGPRKVTLALPVTQNHLQPWGLANGGVYASLGETAGSVAAFIAAGAKPPVVGINNNTDFYRSAKAGDTIIATAEPLHTGRTTHVWHIVHTRESDGAILARTNLRLQVLG